MEFERYYLDLFEMLNSLCKKIASGTYDQSDVDKLFDMAKDNRYPGLFTELAESFGAPTCSPMFFPFTTECQHYNGSTACHWIRVPGILLRRSDLIFQTH